MLSLSPSPPAPSTFNKQRPFGQSSCSPSIVSYFSIVSEADSCIHEDDISSTSTLALSASSSTTSTSEDTTLHADDDNCTCLACPRTPPTAEQALTTVHTEFGHCANENYRCVSQHNPDGPALELGLEEPPYYIIITTYISYLILIIFGGLRDFFGKRFSKQYFTHLLPHDGYAPLFSDFASFYARRLKHRMDFCFSNPVAGVAGRTILLYDRYPGDYTCSQKCPGTKTRALNISSYNYLGFAQARGGCADAVEESITRYGVSTCGSRLEGGSNELHLTAEALVARFVGMEDSLISSMGFATNSTFIPALVGKGSLVISDELNHASIRFGVRTSGAQVRMFKHNDMRSLESLLREVISQGQPKTHRPWKKILVIVEGLYSMEGSLVNLPEIIELKKKYKFYLFVDEAHSIGALGPHGRGVCDYFNIPPRSVDILMGTFTKSFGAAGGYIAGSKHLIDVLRVRGYSGMYAEAISPPVLTQIIACMASIMGVTPPTISSPSSSVPTISEGEAYPGMAPALAIPSWLYLPPTLADGSEARVRIRRLAFNSRYLRAGLKKLGFIIYGHPFSPIVPLLIYNPTKMAYFSLLMRNWQPPIAVVVVGYPVTALVTSRVRLCVSAAHTKDDIDTVLQACNEIGDALDLKHGHSERWPLEEIMKRSVELVNQI